MTAIFLNFGSTPYLKKVLSQLRTDDETIVQLDAWHRGAPTANPRYFLKSDSREEFLDPLAACFGGGPAKLLREHRVLPMDEDASAFFASLDRVFLKPLSMFEREQLLSQWVDGWAKTLSQFSPMPSRAVFDSTPHFHWDISLFLALRANGVKTYTLSQSAVDGRLLLGELSNLQKSHFVKRVDSTELNHVPALEGKVTALVQRSKARNDSFFVGWEDAAPIQMNIRVLAKWLFSLMRGFGGSFRKVPYWTFNSVKRMVFIIRWVWTRKRLMSTITTLSSQALPKDGYAYFALHFQPEQSTLPEAGRFWYQVHAVRLFRAALPDKMTLVVGEHPKQVVSPKPDLRQINFRKTDFYRELTSIPGVQMADWKVRGSELIEGARIVGTCTGSTGWEGMLQGKPSVVMAKTWYSDCLGCIELPIEDDAKSAIEHVLELSNSEVKAGTRSAVDFSVRHGIPGYRETVIPSSMGPVELESLASEASKILLAMLATANRSD